MSMNVYLWRQDRQDWMLKPEWANLDQRQTDAALRYLDETRCFGVRVVDDAGRVVSERVFARHETP